MSILGRIFGLQQPEPVAAPRSTAVYVGNNRLLVGTTIGEDTFAFYVEADDRLLTPWFALRGVYEEDVTRFLLNTLQPDSHCIDVGANFGYFLCLMGKRCPGGRVLGVEPDPELAGIASDNLIINGLHGHTSMIRGAAAERTGELTLHRREFRSGNTSIIAVDHLMTDAFNEPLAQPFTVSSHSIDDLADRLDGRVDVMKVDVEGAEPLVLAGAARTIDANPQIVIVMEWSPGQIAGAGFPIPEFVRQIAGLGLRCSILVDDAEQPIANDALATLPYQSAIILRRTCAA